MPVSTPPPGVTPASPEAISLRIANVRGQRVILDADLAALYEVPTKRFNEAVRRNQMKFPADFMFQLTPEEWVDLRSQIATSNAEPGRGGRRYLPQVFTEHGALMAANLLNSPRAADVSIYVVRAFVRLRAFAASHLELAQRLDELERKTEILSRKQDNVSRSTREQLQQVFEALRALTAPPEPQRRPMGFVPPEHKDEPRV